MISCSCLGHIDYGRFGNQLFQYSISKVLSYIHNTTFALNPDGHFLNFFDTTRLTYSQLTKPVSNNYIENNSFYYDEQLLNYSSVNLIGFFQNINYYQNYLDIIKQELQPNIKVLNETYEYIQKYTENTDNIICFHIRRRDYQILQSLYGYLDLDYYLSISNKLEYEKIFIVSDDIELIKTEFINQKISTTNVHFVDDLDVYKEFFIIYLCPTTIIANSSFSWWACILSNHNKKAIYYPDPWMLKNHNGEILPQIDLFPENWNRISITSHKWLKLFQPQ